MSLAMETVSPRGRGSGPSMVARRTRRLSLPKASRTRVFGGSLLLIVYQKRFSKIVGLRGGCSSRVDAGVSTCGNNEIEADGDSTKWADVRVCAVASSSDVDGNESGDGAGGRL